MSWDKPWVGEGTARPRSRFFGELEHAEQERIMERIEDGELERAEARRRETHTSLLATNANWLVLVLIAGVLSAAYVSAAGLDRDRALLVVNVVGGFIAISAVLRGAALTRTGRRPYWPLILIALPFVVLISVATRRYTLRDVDRAFRTAPHEASRFWDHVWSRLR